MDDSNSKQGIDGPLTARQLMWILWAPTVIILLIWLVGAGVISNDSGDTSAVIYPTENNAEEMADRMEAEADAIQANAQQGTDALY